ncbi:sensor domain-containing diguanylate cyclase [Ornithinibacillus californiensis]|uniref:sensor domain-containing diguanylate cyclase n=1 Tax=Ornithinibacillus californiensis TaxID=161536 RepID=UPI00064DDD7A|nr:sensor domain-containing diguanylate cyclase [Ornithinibacillus californiensis]
MIKALEKEIDNNILDLIWKNTTDAIFTLGHDGSVLYGNPAFEDMLGWKLSELNGIEYPPFIVDMSKEDHQVFINELKAGKEFPYSVVKRKDKYGNELDILASYRVINNEKVLAVAMYKDFTEQMAIQRKLEESEYCYRMLVEYLPETIIKQRDGIIDFVNETGVKLFGKDRVEEVIGYSMWDFITSDQMEEIQEVIDGVYEQEEFQKPKTVVGGILRKDGYMIYAEVKVIPIGSKEKRDIQIVIRDVTEKKQYESKLEYLAYHDPLTGLKNRRLFTRTVEDSMKIAEENKEEIAILYIDIDKFKSINDTYGHDIGDSLLVQFSKRLKSSVREQDELCRVGGDEFLVLLKGIKEKNEVNLITERIHKAFQEPYQIGDKLMKISSSIGISVFPKHGTDTTSLIYHADQALYRAKEERNQFQFYN